MSNELRRYYAVFAASPGGGQNIPSDYPLALFQDFDEAVAFAAASDCDRVADVEINAQSINIRALIHRLRH